MVIFHSFGYVYQRVIAGVLPTPQRLFGGKLAIPAQPGFVLKLSWMFLSQNVSELYPLYMCATKSKGAHKGQLPRRIC